jgi:hypothetical protein
MKKLTLSLCCWLVLQMSFAQQKTNEDTLKIIDQTIEATRADILINDILIQNECTDAINALYNFDFEKADMGFRWLKFKHPSHPLGYFLLGLCEWWKIMPNVEETRYDDKFLHYMDTTIVLAKNIYKKDETNYEAKFFLAAAYGFKGRLHAERKHWTKATLASRNALEYLKKGRTANELSPEFLFGDALYNYYAIWIAENYKFLRPVISLFPKGNKTLGMQQLDKVTRYAFYTRTEAQYFLMRIYANEESNISKAFPIAEYLVKSFPNNAYFERSYARFAYELGRLEEAEKASKSILEKVQQKKQGYEGTSGRYAAFYLGYMYLYNYRDKPKALEYLKQVNEFSKQTNSESAGYNIYALLYQFRILKEENKKAEALAICEKIQDLAEKDQAAYKETKEYLKLNKKKKFLFW